MPILLFLLIIACGQPAAGAGTHEYVATSYTEGDFKLVWERVAADVYVSQGDAPAVLRCVKDFAEDVKRVTGKRPARKHSAAELSSHAVIIGTLGTSTVVDELARSGKIDVADVKGQWETFKIQVVNNPLPGVEKGLVIVGSDRRGTMYGIYDVSENIGVSPWYWFADVTPQTQTKLVIRKGTYQQGPPSVKYRGIFINDEVWGLRPWSQQRFPEDGIGVGPQAYRRIFELMLRLKANYIWPAMFSADLYWRELPEPGWSVESTVCTRPFNSYEQNKQVADEYAIVMGSSHCEPMLRNSYPNAEWNNQKSGDWDYTTNRDNIYKFWEQRVVANGKYENVYTLGKRGQVDGAMREGRSKADKVQIMERILADQRTILSQHVNPNLTRVPQLLVFYSEVLDLYYAGLDLPQDVTLGWVDDNQGYIRSLPDRAEQQRSGGSGVYYHIAYKGGRFGYLWLYSTPPALIWEEMHKAWEYNARNLWIVNVGDIKPAEIGVEFFLKLAWDVNSVNHHTVRRSLLQWAERDFGAAAAEDIVDVLEKYFQLGYARKPEHMNADLFSIANYGDEAQQRVDAYQEVERQATAIHASLPDDLKDAFYQMVLYQVRCAMLQNKKLLYARKSRVYGAQRRASAKTYARQASRAYLRAIDETVYYNKTMSDGKWDGMMSMQDLPGHRVYGSSPSDEVVGRMPNVSNYAGRGPPNLNLFCEGGASDKLPEFSVYNQNKYYVDLYSHGAGEVAWKASVSHDWIQLSKTSGVFEGEQRLWVTIDWTTAPPSDGNVGSITFTGAGRVSKVGLTLFYPSSPVADEVKGFVESNGYISLEAEHYSRKIDRGRLAWRSLPGLGRTGHSIAVLPTDHPSFDAMPTLIAHAPRVEYDIYVFTPGEFLIQAYAIPTQSVSRASPIRYAIALDDQVPKIVDVSGDWAANVLRGVAFGSTRHTAAQAGPHVLKIWTVDAGIVLDKIVLYSSSVKDSYFGPPESARCSAN